VTMGARRIFLVALLAVFAAAPAAAQKSRARHPAQQAVATAPAATIAYRKVFKSSTPEFVEIKVGRDGQSTYDIRQLDDQPNPEPFPVSAALTAKIFALAADLQNFDGIKLDVRRRVANLGEKTFFYEKDGVTNKVSFNFTTNGSANKLVSIFEGLSLEDQYADQLHRSMRYDPLGLNDILIHLERDLGADMLPDPQALAPLLKQIATNSKYLDIARRRAQAVLASFGPAQ
jgi:hypothetical protein